VGYPYFGITADVDVTRFVPVFKERKISLTVAVMYVLARAANKITEFRYRIRGAEVIEHEVVHPSATILTDEELFSFLVVPYVDDFAHFAALAADEVAAVREKRVLKDPPGKDDLLFMTAIPWLSFTGFTPAVNLNPADSVPRFAWGKITESGDQLRMPLNVHVNHALMDGLHVAKFYANVERSLRHPESILVDA
jgi:chloramphenicol O-acetyltransferase type A